MSDGNVREQCRKLKEGQTNVHNEGRQERKSVATEGIIRRVDQMVRKS